MRRQWGDFLRVALYLLVVVPRLEPLGNSLVPSLVPLLQLESSHTEEGKGKGKGKGAKMRARRGDGAIYQW